MKINSDLMNKYLEREMAGGFKGEKWEKYFRDRVGALVELHDGTIFLIEKPRIETQFCFGESGYDMDEAVSAANAARTNEALFKLRNLRGLDEGINLLRYNGDGTARVLWMPILNGVSDRINFTSIWDYDRATCEKRELDDDDRARLIAGYDDVRKAFDKRLDAYLKRYGLSKVHAWTYWRDA